MRKKRIQIWISVISLSVLLCGAGNLERISAKEKNTVTESILQDAIDIDKISSAEFVYNGIAERYDEEKPEEVDCYISYEANVKVGIEMKDVEFKIDEDKKIITPILPSISINIVTLEEDGISYIPKNPDISLKEVIELCKKDAMNEANKSQKLREVAEENLKSTIEALLMPILDNTGYSLQW